MIIQRQVYIQCDNDWNCQVVPPLEAQKYIQCPDPIIKKIRSDNPNSPNYDTIIGQYIVNLPCNTFKIVRDDTVFVIILDHFEDWETFEPPSNLFDELERIWQEGGG